MNDSEKLWSGIARGEIGGWNQRNAEFAKFVPENSSVLDIGCGDQNLKEYLDRSCTYFGIDTVDIHQTPIVDFNKGILPTLDRRYDIAVLSGVLEYLFEPADAVITSLQWAPVVLTSYQPLESRPKIHREMAPDLRVWKSNATRDEFEQGVRERVRSIEVIGRFNTQTLYRIEGQ